MHFRLGALVTLAVVVFRPVHAQATPLMTVLLRAGVMSEATGTGNLDVTMTIPAMQVAARAPLLTLPLLVPGLARPQKVLTIRVRDDRGQVPLNAVGNAGTGRWISPRAVSGTVVVAYRLLAENIPALSGGPPIGVRIDGDAISGTGAAMIMMPAVQRDYRITLRWDLTAMGPGAEVVSGYGDGDVTLPAGPVTRLESGLFMAGHLQRSPRTGSGPFSAVWAGTPAFDPHSAMLWTSALHAAMSRFFQDKSEPPYRVFLRYNPMNAGGGAAFPHAFVATYGTGVTGESLKSILGHEMTHTWTASDTLGAWYSEGNAVFYLMLLPWRFGLMTADDYLTDLNKTASRYYTNALRDTPEDSVAPHCWDDTRIRVLPYDRGAMYFAVLNGRIRRASSGARSMDDLIRTMIVRAREKKPVNETVWLDLLRTELGDEGPTIHRRMMAGGLMLPESDDFGPCFRRTTQLIREFDLGFDMTSIRGAVKTVKGLRPKSEAATAGLRNGDRISYALAMDDLQGDVNRTLDLQVTRNDSTFHIAYLPRGKAVSAYQWERNPTATASECTS